MSVILPELIGIIKYFATMLPDEAVRLVRCMQTE